jgi:hypothetical protein
VGFTVTRSSNGESNEVPSPALRGRTCSRTVLGAEEGGFRGQEHNEPAARSGAAGPTGSFGVDYNSGNDLSEVGVVSDSRVAPDSTHSGQDARKLP